MLKVKVGTKFFNIRGQDGVLSDFFNDVLKPFYNKIVPELTDEKPFHVEIDEDPVIFELVLRRMRAYLVPLKFTGEDVLTKEIMEKYTNMEIATADSYVKRKAAFYINECILDNSELKNAASISTDDLKSLLKRVLVRADKENEKTIEIIYLQGMEIADINQLWIFTAWGVPSVDYLRVLYKHDVDNVIKWNEMFINAASHGEPEHLEYIIYVAKKLSIKNSLPGLKDRDSVPAELDYKRAAEMASYSGKVRNLHFLMLHYVVDEECFAKLLRGASVVDMIKYIINHIGKTYIVTRTMFQDALKYKFCDELEVILDKYLSTDVAFALTEDDIDAICGTDDRMYKFRLLNDRGFKLDLVELQRKEDAKELPKWSCRRVCEYYV